MGVHPAALSDEELLKHCRVAKGRSSGPGGQHRNKVETLVTLTHVPSGLSAHAGERRSAVENQRVALFRVRLLLATRVRAAPEARDALGDIRSELWKSRTTAAGRIVCSPTHRDYPALLAEAMDVIEATGGEERRAALRLGCSPSQLVKLVKDHPPAMERWNRVRAERKLHPLR